ncbi:immunity 26/phosphotriesterase HocA family protein [Pseudalkalibacillus sp. SCS-8]|uniref:immunity 26/phosphotriesterase HocA family protein n=1 Tax=Pseudalkalibacillus nanhaiensis TaxID=3115291 RepID=UPI0032DBBD1A
MNRLFSNRFEIEDDLTIEEIEKLVHNKELKVIQISNQIDPSVLIKLNNIFFSQRNDVFFRVYGFYGEECNLSFLKHMNNVVHFTVDSLMEVEGIEYIAYLDNLKSLGIGIFNSKDFNILNDVPKDLEYLSLGATRSKKPDLAPLQHFKNMENLFIEGQQKNIEVLNDLPSLNDLTLRSITTNGIDYISNLKRLTSLDIKLGSITNYKAIEGFQNIKYLELWQVRGLKDLSFISTLVGLEHLFLQSLKNVEKLPSLENLKKLKKVELEDMKGLKDIRALANAPSLEEFSHASASNMKPADYIPLLQNPSLKKAFCGFGSDWKNNEFDELKAKYLKTSDEEIVLVKMKPSRKKLKDGNIFVLQPKKGLYMFGKVIRANLNMENDIGMNGGTIVHIYKGVYSNYKEIPYLSSENLLLPPQIIINNGWTRGFFMNVGNSEVTNKDIPESYGFYHDFWNKSYDIEGNELEEKPKVCGSLSISNYMVIQAMLNKLYEDDPTIFERDNRISQ